MAREIHLTNGMVAVVDDEDFDRLSRWRWIAVEGRNGCFYAQRKVEAGEAGRAKAGSREMQREVLDPEGVVPRTTIADHRDGNTLDCRKANLRWTTFQQSNLNRRLFRNNKSGYRGVFLRSDGKYGAQLSVPGRPRVCSYGHATPESAARAFNEMALKYRGADAKLNIIPGEEPQCVSD